MKNAFRRSLILLCFLTALLAGCAQHEKDAPKNAESPAEPESRVKHGADGETILTLNAGTQKTMGLQTTQLVAMQFVPETFGYARVVDTSSLGVTLSDLEAARISIAAAEQELTRLKALRAQNNASEKALQAAEAAVAREETNRRGILFKAQAVWGKKLTDLIAAAAPPKSETNSPASLPLELFDLRQVLIRADFPPGESKPVSKANAKFFPLEEIDKPIPGEFFDWAPMADAQTQTRGIFYVLDNKERRWAPGMSLKATVPASESALNGTMVPITAVVWSAGKPWVYRQTEDTQFARRPLTLGQRVDSGWFVTGPLQPGDKVVVAGAQELLSEELKEL